MRRFLAALLAGWLTLLFSACSGESINATEGARRKILLVNNKDDPRWLDLHRTNSVVENNIMLALHEGLVVEGATNERDPDPGIAASWQSNPEKSVWSFQLRPDARWSDGNPITPDDFIWSWQRLLNPKLAAEYSGMLFIVKNGREIFEGKLPADQLGARKTGPHSLEITLTGPTPHFPQVLCHSIWCPLARHCLEKYGDPLSALNPWTDDGKMITSGPFRLKTYLFRRYLEVEKNPHYWDAATVKLDGIRFYPITSEQTEDRLFRRGQLHITYNVPLDKAPTYLHDHPDVIVNDPNLAVRFYRVNTKRKPFDDARVRRALGLAIDRQSLVDNVLRENQRPAFGVVPPMDGYDEVKGFSFDIAEAQRLLAEAGFPGGQGWPTNVKLHIADSERAIQVAEAMQAMWQKNLGIRIPIRMEDYNSYLSSQQHMDYDISDAGWNADYYDPATFIDMWLTDGGNNRTGWSNPAFDKLLEESGQCTDAASRLATLRKAEALLLSEAPVLPYYYYTRTRMIHPAVVGWTKRLLDDRMWKYFDLRYPPPPSSMDGELRRE